MLWVKSLHIIFMVAWFVGLFYLPRLFVYHAQSTNEHEQQTLIVMERRLLIMMHIGAVLAMVFGLVLLFVWLPGYMKQGWLHLKLLLVVGLCGYHYQCMRLVKTFRNGENQRSDRWYRLFNEVPFLFLAGIVVLVVVRPF